MLHLEFLKVIFSVHYIFLICINNLSDNLTLNTKLFVNHTYFSVDKEKDSYPINLNNVMSVLMKDGL